MAVGSSAAGPSVVSAVVWEWQRDDGGFSPYPPEVSAKIELAKKTGTSFFVSIGKWSVDLSRSVQIRHSTGTERLVRRTTCSLPSSPNLHGYWEWEISRRRFVPYGIQASVDIEQASLSGCVSVDLSTTASSVPYLVDMVRCTQTRHDYGTERRVRRITLAKPLQEFLRDSSKPAGWTMPAASMTHPAGKSTSTYSSAIPASLGGSTASYPLSAVSTGWTSPALSMIHPASRSTTAYPSAVPASLGESTATYPLSAPLPPASSTKTSKSSTVSGRKVKKYGHSSSSAGSSKATPTPLAKGKSARRSGKKKQAATEPEVIADRVLATDASLLGPMTTYVERVLATNLEEDGPCPICMNELSELSGFEEDAGLASSLAASSSTTSPPSSHDLYKLRLCGHLLHRPCLIMLVRNTSDKNGLTCPTCKKIYGVRKGDMPNGRMSVNHSSYSLPGHEGMGTIEITYDFSAGRHNGVRYRADGFPRTCYLPDSSKGRKVLDLLRIAWERRLTFTIGTSVTTGATNTIVWNEIHHKTESTSNYSGHGYPDPNYLDNVLAELAALGIQESDDEG